MKPEEEAAKKAESILGMRARCLGSKSGYSSTYREHLVVFNSNVISERHGKVWYGDLDITLEESKLRDVATQIGKIYVLREMDGRFQNEKEPKIERAVYMTDGFISEIGREYLRLYARTHGKITRRKQFYTQHPKSG